MKALTPDGRLLFITRIARLFAYGFLAVVLVLYLIQVGLSEASIGLLLTLTLIGDTAISLWLTTRADRFGRRRTLILGTLLMMFAAIFFANTQEFVPLLIAATIGVISPSGNEVGPFLSVEQAALAQIVPDRQRTHAFAWYNLVGSFATAFGALCGGGLAQALQDSGVAPLDSYRAIVIGYGLLGLLLLVIFTRLSAQVEAAPPSSPSLLPGGQPSRGYAETNREKRTLGLHRSRRVVFKLSALFSLDAFAGGFIVSSFVAYWLNVRFGAEPGALGAIFFAGNILAGFSALMAARLAGRIGLIKTMVYTHIPSNILLMLVPLMPTLPLAVLVLLLRFSISQMDVPTRQSYTMAVVAPDERSAAAGVTGVARTTGAAISPSITGALLGYPALLNVPFYLAGSLKILYDLLLYHSFKTVKPPEETAAVREVRVS
jgi:MFS family permease